MTYRLADYLPQDAPDPSGSIPIMLPRLDDTTFTHRGGEGRCVACSICAGMCRLGDGDDEAMWRQRSEAGQVRFVCLACAVRCLGVGRPGSKAIVAKDAEARLLVGAAIVRYVEALKRERAGMRCIRCSEPFAGFAAAGSQERPPIGGDVVLCSGCGTLLTLEWVEHGALRLRKAVPGDQNKLPAETVRNMARQQRQIRRGDGPQS